MRKEEKNFIIRRVASGFLIFLLITVLFSSLRRGISSVCSSLLAVTGELKVDDADTDKAEAKDGNEIPAARASQAKKQAPRKKPKPQKNGPPTVTDLPKTSNVHVLLNNKIPLPGDSALIPAPDLRSYDGQKWEKEKTELSFSIYERTLYVFSKCGDSDVKSLYTEATEREGAGSAWKDDGIEIFLMKDRKSKFYCQYIISASGVHSYYILECGEDPEKRRSLKIPDDFIAPSIRVELMNDGYFVYAEIDLSNIELDKETIQNGFLLQFVRNYRGWQKPEEANLQLFPVHIYADNRGGDANHHRQAFQPVKITRRKDGND